MCKFKAILAKILMIKYLGVKDIKIVEIDGKFYLQRKKDVRYFGDFGICIAAINCLKIFGINIPIIVTDIWFDDLTRNNEDMKQFILRHEIGHYELKHFQLDLDSMTIDDKINIEIEADKYASDYVGNNMALYSLESLEVYLDTKLNTHDDSIMKRINVIKEKIETA